MQEVAPITYFNRIALLTDLQGRSQSALSYARAFARYYSSHLTLLHASVSDPSPNVVPLTHAPYGHRQRKHVNLLAAEMVDTGLNVDAVVRHGESESTVLLKAIKELGPDLVIQGSAAVDDLRRSLLGSTAEEVFRSTAVPVLTVNAHVNPYMSVPLQFKRIFFVTDFGSRVETTAMYALSLAQEFRAQVRLCHVHEDEIAP